jgi:hypothetical protein
MSEPPLSTFHPGEAQGRTHSQVSSGRLSSDSARLPASPLPASSLERSIE